MRSSDKILQKTCLKQHYSLRRQLLTSFGSATFITLILVVIVSITVLIIAGNLVKESGSNVMKEQVRARLVATTKTTAATFGKFREDYDGVLQQVVEITMDRIAGYPDSGWEEDLYVPFYDIDSQRNVYPLKADPVPLDWRIERDVTDANFAQVLPGRNATTWLSLAKDYFTYSTGSFFMQGQCDPEIRDPTQLTFFPNCTEANNNVATGGAVRPTPTAWGLYNKSAELAVLLRPLYESNAEIVLIGIHFFNSGAGATVWYPGWIQDAVGASYKSQGCDWLRELNTSTGAKLATEEEIARCHRKGTIVKGRNYNYVEREFFQKAVLNRGAAFWFGPYRRAGVNRMSVFAGCKAVFDRRTGALIGVACVHMAMPDVDENLSESRLFEDAQSGIMDYSDGRVLTDSLQSTIGANVSTGSSINVTWWDLGIMSKTSFTKIRDEYTTLFATSWTNATLAAVAESVEEVFYGMATAYPIPVPPQQYDPHYKPYALAIQVVTYDAYAAVDEFQSSIDNDVLKGSLLATGIGVLGMIAILVMLWCVARVLTQPFLWMEQVSCRIVNHDDGRSGNALSSDGVVAYAAVLRCTPRTEITQMVEEFRLMITGFSGSGASRFAPMEPNYIRNTLTWQSNFQELYATTAGRNSIRSSSITAVTPSTDPEESCSDLASENPHECGKKIIELKNDGAVSKLNKNTVFLVPQRRHVDPVAVSLSEERRNGFEDEREVYRSRLFWWIVLLIVLPLIITNTVITCVVTRTIRHKVPGWVGKLSLVSYDLEMTAWSSIVKSKATLLKMILQEPVRDLYWLSRVAGWLYFDAVPRADSFTELSAPTEQCKSSPLYQCELLQTDRFQCPCDWNDTLNFYRNCTRGFNESESRRRQTRFYAVLAQDIDPDSADSGNRSKATSYPTTANSAETTEWQTNISALPGAQKGANASGFETTYDRLRVSSALAVVELPLYNYREAAGFRRYYSAIQMGFEADGMMTGFTGCLHSETNFARFQSSESTKAFEISEELCPEGKYGFDPRCRDWYNTTRYNFLNSGQTVHLTPPYYDENVGLGLTVTSPVADPVRGQFIGVASIDCSYQKLEREFALLEFPISFLITSDMYSDSGGDTVVGLNKSSSGRRSFIVDDLFQYNDNVSLERLQFENDILMMMKSGQSGTGSFSRHRQDGKHEDLVIAYAPVNITVLSPLDLRTLKNGVNVSTLTMYSLAVVNYDIEVRRPFKQVEQAMVQDLERLAFISAILVALLSIIFFVLVCKVTVYVTIPMITLLNMLRNINSNEGRRVMPPLIGGSREVHLVYSSFSKLSKILSIANATYFSGKLVLASQLVSDAIQLFRKIKDRKAIGIACNNLGIVMLARYLELGKDNRSFFSKEYGECASQHLNEAVELSHNEYDSAGSISSKVVFAQELADRLFNRVVLQLMKNADFDAPENTKQRCLQDLIRTRDLDEDVKEYYIENNLLLQFSDECFNRILRRIHGLCTCYNDKEVISVWDPARLLDEADELLFALWHENDAPLFREISRVGRLQQLEGAAIRLETCKGHIAAAARIGMRMFIEDEYLLEGPFSFASTALLHFVQSDDGKSWPSKTITSIRSGLGKMSRTCRSPTCVLGKGVVFVFELTERLLESDPIFPLINSNCLNLFDNNCSDEDFIGVVAQTVKGDETTLELSSKADHRLTQRTVLDLASKSTSEGVHSLSLLLLAMQMVVASSFSDEVDTYILVFSDEYSWELGRYTSMKLQLVQMNRENESNFHLIILGIALQPKHAEECKSICSSISKRSFFAELTVESIDETFARVSSIFSSGRLYHQLLSATAMQQF